MRRLLLLCLAGLLHGVAWAQATQQRPESPPEPRSESLSRGDVGVVLLHGKWGQPPAPLASRLAQAGFQVVSPEMGWSRSNAYRITYQDSLAGVRKEVEKLRASGVKKVVIGGQSFGANGALAYAGHYGEVDGVILFAPGHNPDIDRNRDPVKVRQAKALIEKGEREALIEFTDHNDGGRVRDIQTSPTAYLSYFDPEGLASMPASARRIKVPVPVIVFMGRSDFVTTKGPWYFFNHLPRHPASLYQVSPADHREVPAASYDEALKWIETVIMSH